MVSRSPRRPQPPNLWYTGQDRAAVRGPVSRGPRRPQSFKGERVPVKFAKRMSDLPPYVFASLAQRIAARRARGDKVINFGMGDPDVPMPDPLVDALCAAAHD